MNDNIDITAEEVGKNIGDAAVPPPEAVPPTLPTAEKQPVLPAPEKLAEAPASVVKLDFDPPVSNPPPPFPQRGKIPEKVQMPKNPIHESLVQKSHHHMEDILGRPKDSVRTYIRYTKHFLLWLEAREGNVGTMGPDTLAQFVAETYPNSDQTRQMVFNHIGRVFDVAKGLGFSVTEQTPPIGAKPRTPKAFPIPLSPIPAAPTPEPTRTPAMPTPNQPTFAAVPIGQSTSVAPMAPVAQQMQQPQTMQPILVQMPPMPAPRREAPVPKRPDLLPTGGKIRLMYRSPGGPGVPPGAMISIGTYYPQHLMQDGGDLTTFIERNVHSHYVGAAVKAHVPHLVYVAQRLDERGNIVSEHEYPFAVSDDDHFRIAKEQISSEFGSTPLPTPLPSHNPALTQVASPSESLLQLIMSQNERMQQRLLETPSKDTAQIDMLRREIDDNRNRIRSYEEQIERERRENREKEERERREREAAAAQPRPLQNGPLAGLFDPPTAQPQRQDVMADALVRIVERVTSQPPPAPPAPPITALAAPEPKTDPFLGQVLAVLLKKLTEEKPTGIDPVTQQIIEGLREDRAALREELREVRREMNTPKDKPLESTLSALEHVMAFSQKITGGNQPTWIDAVEALAPHVGPVIAGILSGRGAPQLPGTAPRGQPAPGPGQTPIPPEVKQILRGIAVAPNTPEGDQQILNGLFTMLPLLEKTPGLDGVARAIAARFAEADSKPELRTLVTTIFKACGENELLRSEPATERITLCLHRTYSFIYKSLTGKDKVLADVEQAAPAPTPIVTPAPAPKPVPAPVAPVDLSGGDDDEEDADYEAVEPDAIPANGTVERGIPVVMTDKEE